MAAEGDDAPLSGGGSPGIIRDFDGSAAAAAEEEEERGEVREAKRRKTYPAALVTFPLQAAAEAEAEEEGEELGRGGFSFSFDTRDCAAAFEMTPRFGSFASSADLEPTAREEETEELGGIEEEADVEKGDGDGEEEEEETRTEFGPDPIPAEGRIVI